MIRTAREFGALVRRHRKAIGITQAELAGRIGSGERFVVDLEAGKPSCQLEKALLAAVEVGIDLAAAPVEAPRDPDELAHVPASDGRARRRSVHLRRSGVSGLVILDICVAVERAARSIDS